MARIKMSWHPEDGRLAGEWVGSEAAEPYHPAWMDSSYPHEASTRRCGTNLSPFGKPALFVAWCQAPESDPFAV
ncbi:MAG: hypothetical protein WBE37_25625 [Bryobacteraceae bacterium]